mgnify:CR=1 FL=1
MPRWWTEGADWLAGLTAAVEHQCELWDLAVSGPVAHGSNAVVVPVTRAFSSPAITVTPDTGVLAALALMTQRRIRHLPVVEGGGIVGIVSIGDLVKFRMERIEAEAEAMRAYIQTA